MRYCLVAGCTEAIIACDNIMEEACMDMAHCKPV